MTSVKGLASLIGANEAGLCLILTIFIGYPLALVYRKWFCRKSSNIQHLFFITTGMSLVYWNYGTGIIHSLICILVAYLLCRFGGGKKSILFAFAFFMTYLLIGYSFKKPNSYDIKWTMPHCVLTLRLIGLVTDVFDGQKSRDELADDQVDTAIKTRPGLLEVAAYCYFFGSFMVGPQFPLTRFRKFVNGEYLESDGPPNNLYWSMERLVIGTAYMIIHQILTVMVPTNYFVSIQFENETIILKLIHLFFWFRGQVSMYIGVWIIVEGVCTLAGLSYNGVDENEKVRWDGLRNIRLWNLETGYTFQAYIDSFNVITNRWAAKYVYKRLKFLGSKLASQFLALLFLSLWHGLYTGYFVCFLLEFFTVLAERMVTRAMRSHFPNFCDFCQSSAIFPIYYILYRLVQTYCLAFGALPFFLLSFDRWWKWVIMLPIAHGFCFLLKQLVPEDKTSINKTD